MKLLNYFKGLYRAEHEMQFRSVAFRSAEKGRSIVELLGVLTVIGVVSIAGITGYRNAMQKYAANQIVGEVNLVRSEMQMAMERDSKAINMPSPYSEGRLSFSNDYPIRFGCWNGTGDVAPTDCSLERNYFVEIDNLEERVCAESMLIMPNYPAVDTIFINNVAGTGDLSTGKLCRPGNNTVRVVFQKDGNKIKIPTRGDANAGPIECVDGETFDSETNSCVINDGEQKCVYSPSIRADLRMSNFKMAGNGLSATVDCGLFFTVDYLDGSSLSFTITYSGWTEPLTREQFNQTAQSSGTWTKIKEYCRDVVQDNYGWLLNGGLTSGANDGNQYGAGKLARKDMSSKYTESPFMSYYMCEY